MELIVESFDTINSRENVISIYKRKFVVLLFFIAAMMIFDMCGVNITTKFLKIYFFLLFRFKWLTLN